MTPQIKAEREMRKENVLKMFEQTARLSTFLYLRPFVVKKEIKKLKSIKDYCDTLHFGQIRRVEALDPEKDDLPTRVLVVGHYTSALVQRQVVDEVMQYCKDRDRVKRIDEDIQKTRALAQEAFDSLPADLLGYQQRNFDVAYRLRPSLMKREGLINRQRMFTFYFNEGNQDRGDYHLCDDTTEGTLKLEDFVAVPFRFGDSVRRSGAQYAMIENNIRWINENCPEE